MKRITYSTLTALLLAACSKPSTPPPASPEAPKAQEQAEAAKPSDVAPVAAGLEDDALGRGELGDAFAEVEAVLSGKHWADAATFKTLCEKSLVRAKAVKARFAEGRVKPEQAISQLNLASYQLDPVMGLAGLLFNTNPAKDVRDAAEACEQAISSFSAEWYLDANIYGVLAKIDASTLSAEEQLLLKRATDKFRRSGVDKDEATRTRIAKIQQEITQLSQEFSKNVNGDTRTVFFTREELAGLPEDFFAKRKTDEEGKFAVTTDTPDAIPVLTYATKQATRNRLNVEYGGRGYPANKVVLEKVLALRGELAKLTGFENYAALNFADKMAKNPLTVQSFLLDAHTHSKDAKERDLKVLLERLQKDEPSATQVGVPDRLYLMDRVRAEQLSFDSQSVRQYFPYAAVRDGIFAVFSDLFELDIRPAPHIPTWHEAVEAWEVREKGEVIGIFFLDNHPRADKYKHAAVFPIQVGVHANGALKPRLPYASLVCNFSNPAEGEGLLDHSQVTTFFHEFGHLIHHLLARAGNLVDLSGINVEWDFVEVPSQLIEEWAWDPQVLARFAKNKDGEVISAETVERMRKAEDFGKGASVARQLFYAYYSLTIHERAGSDLDLEAFTNELYEKVSPYPRPEGDRLYANFGHLLGYDASYYTYQWSLAHAKDFSGMFKEKGLMDPEVAHAYRDKVLRPGGTKPAEVLVKDFLGRDFSFDAYIKWLRE